MTDYSSELDEILADLAWLIDAEASQRKSTAELKSLKIADIYASQIAEAKAKLANLIAQAANKAVVAKNYAYWERNQLVGVLSRLYPSHLARHDENDKEWEDDWRNIVCVHTPVGQATWHLQDNDMPMFAHLKRGADHWDGHTTEEKYHRLAQLTADKEEA